MAETSVGTKTKSGWKVAGMASSSEEEDAVVPGVNKMGPGNLRPKARARRPRPTPSKAISKPSAADDLQTTSTLSVQDLSQSLDERRLQPAGGVKRGQVSLKDLCVEDKQRIANLIKELARVGEDREKAREELEKERRSYEQQILKLVEQQEQILQERQEVERHLQECQQLLVQSQRPPPPSFHPPPPPSLPPPASFPPHPYPQWAWPETQGRGQDVCHSVLGNVGSPSGRQGPSVPSGGGMETEVYRHQNQALISDTAPPRTKAPQRFPSQAGGQYQSDPDAQAPEQHRHDQQQLLQTPSDFFASAMQQALPLDFYPGQIDGEHVPDSQQASKEEVIQRFFASQPPDRDTAMISPKRRDRQKSAARGKRSDGFLPPIMSSTQKSAEIKAHLSVDSRQEYAPLVPDLDSESRLSGGSDGGGGGGEDLREGRGGERRVVNRVAFHEGGEREELHLHSPLDDAGDTVGPAHNYHKMSQSQRKEQLLQQRALLLQEQQRLKHILSEQEHMLHEKQQALSARTRRHGNAPTQEGLGTAEVVEDEDPLGLVPQRLAIDAALERQRAIVDSLELEAQQRNSASKPKNNNKMEGLPGNQPRGREMEGAPVGSGQRGKENGDTFVVQASNKLSDVVRKLDYSLHSDTEELGEDGDSSTGGENAQFKASDPGPDAENVDVTPQRQDAGTSVSYHTISRPSYDPAEQGLVDQRSEVNRGLSASHPPPSRHAMTPGEKTMSVLEIINSLHSPRSRPDPAHPPTSHKHRSPLLQEFSPSSHRHRELLPLNRWRGEAEEYGDVVDDSGDDVEDEETEDVNEEDLEESQILEEIFFLK